MALEVTGIIEKILDLEKGTTAAGKEWQKQNFILKTDSEYNNVYCFEIFGEEKVQNFLKFNKVGFTVKVDFNVGCNEWKGKYFTSLQAWKVFKAEAAVIEESATATQQFQHAEEEEDSLPF